MQISTNYGPDEVLALIEGRLRELGMSQTQLGQKAFGKADNTAIQSLKKGSSPAFDRLGAMAHALGWEVYFGPPRKTPDLQGLAEPDHTSDLGKKDAFRAGFLPLPWLEGLKSDGVPPVAFSALWLESQGLKPESLACLRPENALIEGVALGAMLAVIDKSAAKTGFGLWAIVEEGRARALRVLFEGPAMVILATDPAAAPRLIPNWKDATGIRVAGKVIWIGHPPA